MNLLDCISDIEKNKKRVLVVGDIMLDHYEYGEVTRISPEAPVPVVKLERESYVPGGSGNVANNLAALGTEVILVGIRGNDQSGRILEECLNQSGINSAGIIIDETRPTTVKKRIISGKNQLLRLDYEKIHPIDPAIQTRLLSAITPELGNIDAVIISDYAKGVLTQELAEQIIILANAQKTPIIIDGKPKNEVYYKNATLIKPNLKEAKEMTGIPDNVEHMGKTLVERLDSNVFITMGDKGIYVFEKNGKSSLVPTKKVIHVYDVTGAGDTVTAISALGLAHGLNLVEIADLANIGGRLVVQKPGTATTTWDEIRKEIDSITIRESYERHEKEWGYEEWIVNLEGAGYCSKKLVLNRGYQCSIHHHREKDEAFYINQGYILLLIDGKENLMKPGSRIRIPPETKHRFIGLTDAEIFETSTHHRDEDSYRDEPSGKVSDNKFAEYLRQYGPEIKI